MRLYVYGEDPEPAETDQAGLLFVPAQSGSSGCAPRYFPADRADADGAVLGIDRVAAVGLALPKSRSRT
ncbi:hypothetical protein [Streptomyces sp. NBC_01217]|uniref:hypothetical protein n=1 Tax=Streptomyces sp. NBC_01217 TaxID=2903779 RepID=UPI002E13ED44|nr:hypothetical protein OG507_00665 [Streptomyces sp. NBC_01217]